MATIDYTYTDDRPNIVYQITCNCTRSSNTQITYSGTVTWNLRYPNSYIGPGYILECKATSSTGGDSGWISFTEYGKEYRGTTKRSFNYSFTATSSSAGAFDRVTFSFRNNSSYHSGYNSCSTYVYFSTPALLWTNCTAPSTVSSTSSSIITPGTLSVNWTEGTPGVDNAIKNYTVYWLVSSTSGQLPTTSWYSGKEVISGLSYSIPIPENYRGKYISVKVQSNATYNSPISSSSVSRSVNSLPSEPTTSGSVVVSSTTPSAMIEVSPGKANFGSSSTEVHYATSITGKKNKAGNSVSVPRGNTYYFWTWDGLEYSSSYSVATVTAKIPPNIKVALDGVPVTSTNSSYSEKNIIEAINFKISELNKSCYYSLNIYNKDNILLKTWKNDVWITTETSVSLDARSIGLPSGEYYFSFSCRDNLESGNTKRFPETSASYYYIPPLPTFSSNTTYNQFSDGNVPKNVPGANSTDFYQKLRFASSHYDSYLYDNGIFRLDTGSNETISYTVAKKKDSDTSPTKIFYDVTITSDLVSGQTYDFFPTLQLAGLTSSALVSRRRTPVLDPTPSSGSTLYIKPFTDGWNRAENKPVTSSKKISISKGSFVGGTLDDGFYKYYNIDENSKEWWKSVIITPDGKELNVTDLVKGGALSGDYYEREFKITGSRDQQTSKPESDFFDKLPDDFSKTGVLTCALKNTIKNRFGQTISKQSSIVILDFNEEPLLGQLRGAPTTGDYLIEGGRMSFGIPIYTFSTNDLSFSFLIDRQDGKGFVTYREGDSFIYGGEEIPFGTGRYISLGINIPIKEITGSSDCFFALRIFDGQKEIDTKGWTVRCKRIKMSPPILSFTKTDYEAGKKNENDTTTANITCHYTITDPGYDFSQIVETDTAKITVTSELTLVLPRGDSYPIEKNLSQDIGTQSYIISPSIDDFQNAKLVLKNTLSYTIPQPGTGNDGNKKKTFTIEKSSTSNDLIIYGITPTVAYRQNHLGINTSTLQNDSILTIAPTSGRNTIYLQKFGSTDTFKINLATGALEGFIFNIDCGEIRPET